MKIENITLKFRQASKILWCHPNCYFRPTTVLEVFDNPVGSCIKSVVLRLGGFHLQMSFLGSIGHLMAGSGLQELLETLYAVFSVPTSGPQLVYQRPWYVLFCLWKSAYKRSLAAYRKEKPMWRQRVSF